MIMRCLQKGWAIQSLWSSFLREAIKIKPDYAVAYNALGYSFADRNIKLEEAKINIEIALISRTEKPLHYGQYGLGTI